MAARVHAAGIRPEGIVFFALELDKYFWLLWIVIFGSNRRTSFWAFSVNVIFSSRKITIFSSIFAKLPKSPES
mgnify:CR=1 FL=1